MNPADLPFRASGTHTPADDPLAHAEVLTEHALWLLEYAASDTPTVEDVPDAATALLDQLVDALDACRERMPHAELSSTDLGAITEWRTILRGYMRAERPRRTAHPPATDI